MKRLCSKLVPMFFKMTAVYDSGRFSPPYSNYCKLWRLSRSSDSCFDDKSLLDTEMMILIKIYSSIRSPTSNIFSWNGCKLNTSVINFVSIWICKALRPKDVEWIAPNIFVGVRGRKPRRNWLAKRAGVSPSYIILRKLTVYYTKHNTCTNTFISSRTLF